MIRWGAAGTALALVAALAGCATDEKTTLRVYAASSLSATFGEIAAQFEAAHEGVDVQLSLGGSSDLVAQVAEGAPADVVATADEATMARLVAEDLTGAEPRTFATNTLQLAVPPGNPASVRGLADLGRPGLDLVVCAPAVPCGAAAVRVAESADIALRPVSEEPSVGDVLAKVASGEAEAGLVYVTDVLAAAGQVEGVPLPEAANAPNAYPIAPVADSDHPDLAADFVALVLGSSGQRVLADAGFGPAPPGPR